MKQKRSLQSKITLQTCLLLILVGSSIVLFSMSRANTLFVIQENHPPLTSSEESIILNNFEAAAITEGAKDVFDQQVLLFTFSAIIIGTILIYFTSKKALKPLDDVTSKIEDIDSNHLDKRLPISTDSYEATLIAESFNDLLERIEESFELQKSFSSNVAHELKTPLSIMKTSIQTLDHETFILEDYKQHNARQLEAIDKLSTTVDDLLLIAKGATLTDFPKEDVDLEILINTILQDLESRYKDMNITISSSLKEFTIHANLSLNYRVLYNILENAFKYNIKDGILSLNSYEDPDGIHLIIKNTTNSLEQADVDNIFTPLFRSEISKNSSTPGSGLGMAVVKSIMDSHGNDLKVTLDHHEISVHLIYSK